MKKIFFCMLMVLLPLQSVWAAVQLYHVHTAEEEPTGLKTDHMAGLFSLLHDHSHDHNHDHQFKHKKTTSDSTESDHHHHCAGHFAVVMSAMVGDLQPDLQYDKLSSVPDLPASSIHSRIERPNWC